VVDHRCTCGPCCTPSPVSAKCESQYRQWILCLPVREVAFQRDASERGKCSAQTVYYIISFNECLLSVSGVLTCVPSKREHNPDVL
jgi:hypothetical protein